MRFRFPFALRLRTWSPISVATERTLCDTFPPVGVGGRDQADCGALEKYITSAPPSIRASTRTSESLCLRLTSSEMSANGRRTTVKISSCISFPLIVIHYKLYGISSCLSKVLGFCAYQALSEVPIGRVYRHCSRQNLALTRSVHRIQRRPEMTEAGLLPNKLG